MNAMTLPDSTKSSMLWVFSFFFYLFYGPVGAIGQPSLSWETLADVTYKEQYDEALDWYYLIPIFGKYPRAYENKTVIIEGYYIPVNKESKFHVLSRYPYSSCFFCGGAGPESVVELQLAEKIRKHISMDKRVRFQGELILNSEDFDHCNYILKAARPLFDSK